MTPLTHLAIYKRGVYVRIRCGAPDGSPSVDAVHVAEVNCPRCRFLQIKEPKRRGPNPESALTQAIVDALTARGFTAWRNNSGTVKIANRLFRGSPAGSPDVFLILPPFGRLCGFEVKMPGKKLRKSQVAWNANARALGVQVITIDRISDAINLAAQWQKLEAQRAHLLGRVA